ncbi:MAG: transporter related protein [Amycolatopsis sp.]|jgi:ABC-type glutathione transport system ATPase component|uniref:ABC transporter ATP-binding protein n=1 Tax=Amycolatopsis sp. TaxID=37632 RepID=UPI00261FE505|nr:ATP-binding cassette domain-containing protein [Amycolatopsis sp.]MCU1680623.1 transporter related protein [Amycolatopsis sp.]
MTGDVTEDDVVVRVEHLVKRYGPAVVVDDVSFTVRRGRTTALVGESGAGKSTIGAILTGLQDATSGTVEVCGEDRGRVARSARLRRHRARQLQIVPQDPFTSLDPAQQVGSSLREAVAVHHNGGKRHCAGRAVELLRSVGLAERHLAVTPRLLSGGQRQRVAIARALAAEPDVLVLDEAVSALDVSVQAQVINLLSALQRDTGTAYLFITHDLGVVRQIADDVIVLKNGRVVEHGDAAQVLDDPQEAYTRLLLASTPRPGWHPVRR